MADGILTIDRHGIVESFNPAAERVFGYTAAEVLGHNVNMLMPTAFIQEMCACGYRSTYQSQSRGKQEPSGGYVEFNSSRSAAGGLFCYLQRITTYRPK